MYLSTSVVLMMVDMMVEVGNNWRIALKLFGVTHSQADEEALRIFNFLFVFFDCFLENILRKFKKCYRATVI